MANGGSVQKLCVCGESYPADAFPCHLSYIEWEAEPWRIAEARNDGTHWHLTITPVRPYTEGYRDIRRAADHTRRSKGRP